MTDGEAETYFQSPLFREAMQNFQQGKWEDGLNQLAEVEKRFPLDVELRSLRQEMQVRSRVEDYEVEDNRHAARKKTLFYAARVALGVVVVLVVFFAASSYYTWFQQRWQATLDDFNAQVVEVETSVKYRNAQDLLRAGQAEQALAIFEELAATHPQLVGLETYLNDAKTLKDVSDRYEQALDLIIAGDEESALAIFKQIETERPQYRDVALQIKTLESQVELAVVLNEGDAAFEDGDWITAVTAYETIQVVDANFQAEYVKEQLYQSYLNAADDVLNEPEPTLEALQAAESYFSRALALRPQDTATLSRRAGVRNTIEIRLVNKYLQDAEAALTEHADSLTALLTAQEYFAKALELRPDDTLVLIKFQLAKNYLSGIDAFAKNKWDQTIAMMEEVVAQDPEYANGTARQTLYEALISTGDDYLAAGEYVLALNYFQRAAILARAMTNSKTGIFEAQTRIAEAQGLLGNHQDATFIYSDALEAAGLRSIILNSNTPLADDLRNAEAYVYAYDYRNAFNLYRKVMFDWVSAVGTEVVSIQAGDYLPMLARRYNTTVSAILAANGLTAQVELEPDTELIIPTTP